MSTHDLTGIGSEMRAAGLSSDFVRAVLRLAAESEGAADLVQLWAEAPDSEERTEIEADLYGMLEDREPDSEPGWMVRSEREAETLSRRRERWKERLRRLVEEHGGVSSVASRAGMPQPSLSRLLNTMSEPRRSTLNRLARAMDLPVDDLAESPSRGAPLQIGQYDLRPFRGIKYGIGSRLVEA